MLFNTIDFIIFLPIVVILYYILPHRIRWTLLLTASYFFYMCWKIEYIILIITSTLIDFFCGIKMSELPTKKHRLPYLILSLITNIGLLVGFKYLNFFSENINGIFQKINIPYEIPLLNVLLPVGISFYTFQTLSYSIDVYSGKQKAERHLGHFALYVSFFPQLVAGPIERFSRLSPQLKAKHSFSYTNLTNGLRLILYGLFVKMVIADNLSGIVDQVYSSPEDYNSISILFSIFFYSFQIYCDFFGYSIIAIGSALIMGIKIMDNFKTPYLANNIADFWQRWHISLSTWFRDYLYYPMGGNRVTRFKWIINILVVFIVSGIWHGANWTFLVWGLFFGIIYLIEKYINTIIGKKNKPRPYSIRHFLLSSKTFILVTFIWVFFRSSSFPDAINIFKLIFTNTHITSVGFIIPTSTWIFLIAFILSDVFLYNKRFDSWIDRFPMPFRWLIYSIMIFSIIVFSGVENFPFIYFQF